MQLEVWMRFIRRILRDYAEWSWLRAEGRCHQVSHSSHGATKDPPCRGMMHVKAVEIPKVLVFVWGGSLVDEVTKVVVSLSRFTITRSIANRLSVVPKCDVN
ncbi:hypothetical protein TNCV_2505091 [Trichonephila clavipes]|uniref:Uncharacterized protein n=1 Tax=Trichonephila clavipes TaxID=2585209 RepID=A0A8X6WHF3_TRICX|nr:hypothetical protein TNCV_2505091 [Trichonephila clavipes]